MKYAGSAQVDVRFRVGINKPSSDDVTFGEIRKQIETDVRRCIKERLEQEPAPQLVTLEEIVTVDVFHMTGTWHGEPNGNR